MKLKGSVRMASFYVINGRKGFTMILLLVCVILALYYVFQPPNFAHQDDPGIGVWTPLDEKPTENEAEEVGLFTEPVVSVTKAPTKFSEYRLDRERVRSMEKELLEKILNDSEVSEQRRIEAQNQLMTLIEIIGKETEIENLLRVKGYVDAITIIRDDVIIVVVPVTLTAEEAGKIGDVVRRITGVSLEKIIIVDEPSLAH